jgi:HSP20 family protein
MSFQDFILNNLQADGDLRGVLHQLINSGIPDQSQWVPPVDIVDTKNNLYVYVELPGVVENSISIDFFNNKLSISGEKIKRYSAPVSKREIVYGKFDRQIVLPISVTNQANVDVKYENGILILLIDKNKEEQNRFRLSVNRVPPINQIPENGVGIIID